MSQELFRLGSELERKSTELTRFFIDEILSRSYALIENSSFTQKDILLEQLDEIKILSSLKMNNNEYYNRIVSTLMQIEFDDKEELLNNYCNSEVKLTGELFGKEIKSELRIDENGIKGQINEEFLNANSNKEAIYTETPFILDDEIPVDYSSIQNGKSYHQNLLKAKLYDFKRRAMFLTILKMKMQSIFKRGLEI